MQFYEEVAEGEECRVPSCEDSPLVPSAGAKTKEEDRFVGRKDFALKKSMVSSLVS